MKIGVYNKDNLTSLFSKVIYQNYILNICLITTFIYTQLQYGFVSNVLVLENKSVALVEYVFYTSAVSDFKLNYVINCANTFSCSNKY